MTVKKRLGEMLLEAGVIDETQLHSALGHQRKWGGKLGQALQDLKLATEPQIVSALSRKFGYDVINIGALQQTAQLEAALRLVPRELALRQTLLPVASDSSSITVAMADPSNIAVVDELSFRTGKRVRIALAGDREITAAVRRLYFADQEPQRVAAIPLDDPSNGEVPLETTRDPFAAMPDHIREGYFNRPSHTLSDASRPAPLRAPAPGPAPRAPAPPPLPPARAATAPAPVPRVDVQPTFTPPPVLARGEATPSLAPWPAPPPPAAAPPQPQPPPPPHPLAALASEPADLLGEPILATELAPAREEEGPYEGPPQEPELTPKQAALLDALERAARGEETGLVKATQLVAVLARLLVKRGLLDEAELLDELVKR